MPKLSGPWSRKREERDAHTARNMEVFVARDQARAHVAECNAAVAKQTEAVAHADREAVLQVGMPGFDEAVAAHTAAEAELKRLMFVQRAAGEKLKVAEQAAHELSIQNLREPFRRQLKKWKESAAAYEASAAVAERDRRALYEQTEALRLLWPDARPPQGALLWPNALTRAVTAHLYKIGANPFLGGSVPRTHAAPTAPGATCPDLRWRSNPSAVPSITEVIAEAAEGLLSQLETAPITVREPSPAAPVEDFSKPVSPRVDDVVDPVTGARIVSGAHLLVRKE